MVRRHFGHHEASHSTYAHSTSNYSGSRAYGDCTQQLFIFRMHLFISRVIASIYNHEHFDHRSTCIRRACFPLQISYGITRPATQKLAANVPMVVPPPPRVVPPPAKVVVPQKPRPLAKPKLRSPTRLAPSSSQVVRISLSYASCSNVFRE